mmetsp:Transcript_79264/g.230166  ORF Transcript_79264/g.230166 Transcript_79264/m.230166 type:complete len:213 (-) Transcript_79264:3350-3988(-)
MAHDGDLRPGAVLNTRPAYHYIWALACGPDGHEADIIHARHVHIAHPESACVDGAEAVEGGLVPLLRHYRLVLLQIEGRQVLRDEAIVTELLIRHEMHSSGILQVEPRDREVELLVQARVTAAALQLGGVARVGQRRVAICRLRAEGGPSPDVLLILDHAEAVRREGLVPDHRRLLHGLPLDVVQRCDAHARIVLLQLRRQDESLRLGNPEL